TLPYTLRVMARRLVCRPLGCPPRSRWWHNFTYTEECKIKVVDAIGPHRGLPASPVSQFVILSSPSSFDVDIFAQETPLVLGLAGGQIEGIGIYVEAVHDLGRVARHPVADQLETEPLIVNKGCSKSRCERHAVVIGMDEFLPEPS